MISPLRSSVSRPSAEAEASAAAAPEDFFGPGLSPGNLSIARSSSHSLMSASICGGRAGRRSGGRTTQLRRIEVKFRATRGRRASGARVGCASAGKGSCAYLLQAQIFEPRGRHGARPREDGGGARWTRLNARATRPIRLETKSNTHSTARRRLASARYRVGGVRSAHATTPRCRTPCVRDRAPRRCARAPSNAPPEATPTRMTGQTPTNTFIWHRVRLLATACCFSSCCLLRPELVSPK